jgi:hypothetical protein
MGNQELRPGDKALIVGKHPWAGHSARLIAYEKYGLGWWGWRVEVDGACGQEAYAKPEELRSGNGRP